MRFCRKNGKEKDSEPFQIFENHIFQEYTYKKITPCDICSQVLRGAYTLYSSFYWIQSWKLIHPICVERDWFQNEHVVSIPILIWLQIKQLWPSWISTPYAE